MNQRQEDAGQAFFELGIEGYERAVEIGRGGFSVVYRVWEAALERDVAVKVVSTDLQSAEVDRFARECAAIGRLAGHPNIVTVYRAGRRAPGEAFIAMEFLSEGSLAERVARQPLAWADAVDIGVKLAGAIESAHRAGVLHRDVKPANVMLSRYGEAKLGDFGIARMEGRRETSTGVVAASWDHAPPEVIDGSRPSSVSDVYSLASTIFTLIDGRPPFGRDRAESFGALLARIVRDPVRPLPSAVPGPVAEVVYRGLAKDPSERPESAAAFGRQLQAAQAAAGRRVTALPLALDDGERDGPPVTEYVDLPKVAPTVDRSAQVTEPAPPAPPVRRTATRRAGVAVALALVMAVVLALIAVNLGSRGEEPIAGGPSSTAPAATDGSAPSTTAAGEASGAAPTSSAPTSVVMPTTVASGVRLGQDLAPGTTEPCRTPPAGTGAAWQLGPVQVGGRAFAAGYSCSLFSAGVGGLDFVLGGSYQQFSTTIGFADASTSTSHRVRFEFVADGRENLIPPAVVVFGDVRDLRMDVSGVTRLQIRITELGSPGGSEGPSRPVLAAPTLTR